MWIPLARCVVPRLQTATDSPEPKACGKDTLSGSANLPGDATSAVEQVYICVCVCMCEYYRVTPSVGGWAHCFGLSFNRLRTNSCCIRTGAENKTLFVVIASKSLRENSKFSLLFILLSIAVIIVTFALWLLKQFDYLYLMTSEFSLRIPMIQKKCTLFRFDSKFLLSPLTTSYIK